MFGGVLWCNQHTVRRVSPTPMNDGSELLTTNSKSKVHDITGFVFSLITFEGRIMLWASKWSATGSPQTMPGNRISM